MDTAKAERGAADCARRSSRSTSGHAAKPTEASNNSPSPAARRTAKLAEPIIISEWWRDRGGRSIRVSLNTYEGHNLVDVRTWWTGDDGKLKPGKGFACSVRHLSQLATAIAKAVERARELGLIDGDDSDE
jgi:hypothetical protein